MNPRAPAVSDPALPSLTPAEADQGSSNDRLFNSCCVVTPSRHSLQIPEGPRGQATGDPCVVPWRGVWVGEGARPREGVPAGHTPSGRGKCGASLTTINQPRNAAGRPGWVRAETKTQPGPPRPVPGGPTLSPSDGKPKPRGARWLKGSQPQGPCLPRPRLVSGRRSWA